MANFALVSQDVHHTEVHDQGAEAVGHVAHGPSLTITVNQRKEEMSYEEMEELRASMEGLRQLQPPAVQSTADVQYVEHRESLVGWIDTACEQLGLACITVHHAIHYLDRVCFASTVNYDYINYIAAACVLIAAKFEECPNETPLISSIVEVALPVVLQPVMLARVEILVLQRLDWRLRISTGYHFICEHKKWGMFPKDDQVVLNDEALPPTDQEKAHACLLVKFFCELSLRDARFLKYQVSVSAAAAWAAGRALSHIAPIWPDSLAAKTGCSKEDISRCYEELFHAFKERHPEDTDLEAPVCLWNGPEEVTIRSPTDVSEEGMMWKGVVGPCSTTAAGSEIGEEAEEEKPCSRKRKQRD